jgi:hypothetical protein
VSQISKRTAAAPAPNGSFPSPVPTVAREPAANAHRTARLPMHALPTPGAVDRPRDFFHALAELTGIQCA